MNHQESLEDERRVDEFRRVLRRPVAHLPLGMRSRFEAQLAMEARRMSRPRWSGVGVLGVLAFSSAYAISPPSFRTLVAAVVAGGVYACLGRWLAVDSRPRRRTGDSLGAL